MTDVLPTHTTKELLWLGCREKTCCYTTKVIVSGKDLWRIANTLDAAPWEFTVYVEAEEFASDAFRLVADGPLFQVALAKRGKVGAKGAPCFFLWRLADGHAQCGLGSLRPLVCRSYPAALSDGMLVAWAPACTCRRWSVLDLDEPEDRRLVEQTLSEAEEYSAIVAAWNDELSEWPTGRDYHDFCRYVLDAYAARERHER